MNTKPKPGNCEFSELEKKRSGDSYYYYYVKYLSLITWIEDAL